MFCPNCGTHNEDDSLFCGSCGTSLKEVNNPVENIPVENTPVENIPVENIPVGNNQVENVQMDNSSVGNVVPDNNVMQQMNGVYSQQQMAPKPPKKPIKINKYVIMTPIFALTFIIAIVAFVLVGKSTYSAETVATDYFEAIANGDWKTAYEMMDISDSEYISQDLFEKAMVKNLGTEIKDYKVKRVRESGFGAVVDITYREKGGSTDESISITLNEADKNGFLFFKTWKVSSQEFVAKDFTIYTAKGATLYLDGNKVSEKYIDSQDTYNDVYKIPKLFKGTHTLQIEVGDFKGDAELYEVMGDSYSYTINSVYISEEQQKEIMDIGYGYMTDIIDAAVKGKKFDSVENIFTSDVADDAKSRYDDYFACDFYAVDKEEGITVVELSDVEGDVESYGVSDGKVYISIRMEYDVLNTGLEKSWWDGTISEGKDDYGSATTYVRMEYVDGEWLISDEYSIPTDVRYAKYFE